MYKIERNDKHVIVTDERGTEVYKGSLDGYIIFKPKDHQVVVGQVREMKDRELLEALATVVKLSLA